MASSKVADDQSEDSDGLLLTLLKRIVLPFVAVWALQSMTIDTNHVPSSSMMPTLLIGDVIYVNNLTYGLTLPATSQRLVQWGQPTPGDVVICFSPEDGIRLVKRVIGVPGDIVEMKDDILIINGHTLDYASLDVPIRHELTRIDQDRVVFLRETVGAKTHAMMLLKGRESQRTITPEVVPAGSYLVLGDNRNNSRDSRAYGYVPAKQIVGRVGGVLYSIDKRDGWNPRFARFFTSLEKLIPLSP